MPACRHERRLTKQPRPAAACASHTSKAGRQSSAVGWAGRWLGVRSAAVRCWAASQACLLQSAVSAHRRGAKVAVMDQQCDEGRCFQAAWRAAATCPGRQCPRSEVSASPRRGRTLVDWPRLFSEPRQIEKSLIGRTSAARSSTYVHQQFFFFQYGTQNTLLLTITAPCGTTNIISPRWVSSPNR